VELALPLSTLSEPRTIQLNEQLVVDLETMVERTKREIEVSLQGS
jgi:hypothetical protein